MTSSYPKNKLIKNDILSSDEFDNPLDMSDIITICKEYSKLEWKVQFQVESILEYGVEQCVKDGIINKETLPHIKNFLKILYELYLLGDAAKQARECFEIISIYEEHCSKISNNLKIN